MESPFKSDLLKGRSALVTGGGSGIGLEIATQLGKHGAKVCLMGRRANFLADAVTILEAEGITAMYVSGDVRSDEDTRKAVETTVTAFGRLDTLVNSAAGNFLATSDGLRPKGFRTVMEIDAMGVFNMCHAAFEHLKKAGNGVIINISATLHYGASWWQIHASAAKAAIDSITRSLGLEWGEFGIRTVGIAPGPIANTAGMTKLAPGADQKAIENMIAQHIPMQRMGTTKDIAYTAAFLCSSAATYITGETIVVDGGAWLWKPPSLPREMVAESSRSIEKKSRAVVGKAKL